MMELLLLVHPIGGSYEQLANGRRPLLGHCETTQQTGIFRMPRVSAGNMPLAPPRGTMDNGITMQTDQRILHDNLPGDDRNAPLKGRSCSGWLLKDQQ